MSKDSDKKKFYTPELHILLGEVVTAKNGEPALRIKKQGCQEYEIVTLSSLVYNISQKALASS